MPSKKRLAIFLDGTTNDVGANTNVWRIKSLCADHDSAGVIQIKHYSEGLGVKSGEKWRGGGIGYGIDGKIRDAYEWLVDHYEDGDDIFIFGFSRGAYTARSLAGLIAKCGILNSGAPLGVNELYERYRELPNSRTIWKLKDDVSNKLGDNLTTQEMWMLKYSYCAPIQMIGVWDTVGALGIPFGRWKDYSSSTFSSLHTGLRLCDKHVYHALAIDEHRAKFAATLYTKAIYRDSTPMAPPRPVDQVEQRWFIGTHGNVGGGYDSDSMPQLPLKWLMGKATKHGLQFKETIEPETDYLTAPIPDSRAAFLGGLYRFFSGPFYRAVGALPVGTTERQDETINESIDVSVFDKWRADPSYRPKNITKWANGLKVKPEEIRTSVLAHDASQIL